MEQEFVSKLHKVKKHWTRNRCLKDLAIEH